MGDNDTVGHSFVTIYFTGSVRSKVVDCDQLRGGSGGLPGLFLERKMEEEKGVTEPTLLYPRISIHWWRRGRVVLSLKQCYVLCSKKYYSQNHYNFCVVKKLRKINPPSSAQ
jgi:hypothetical protein